MEYKSNETKTGETKKAKSSTSVLQSIFKNPLVYKEPLIALITLSLTVISLLCTVFPPLVNSDIQNETQKIESPSTSGIKNEGIKKAANPSTPVIENKETKKAISLRYVVIITFITIFISLGSGFTFLFEIKKINEIFARIKTDDKEQSKKILEYISTVNVGKIDIFDQYLEEQVWNEEILKELNKKETKIYVKNKAQVLTKNKWLAEINSSKNSKIEIKEWGSTALTRVLNIDSLHSRFILVNYEGPDDDSFYSYKRTIEGGEPVYQNFIYSDNKHPVVEMSKDFYHIVEKIRDFSDQLNRPIGYYFVRVSPIKGQTEEQQTQEFSLVEVQAQGEYRIRYRGVGLSGEKDTISISSKWNSTVASFNENIGSSGFAVKDV